MSFKFNPITAALDLVNDEDADTLDGLDSTEFIRNSPVVSATNDILPQSDFEALIIRAFSNGNADIFTAYDKDGIEMISFHSDGSIVIPTGTARHEIGLYGTISETLGGLSYITGNAIAAHPTIANTLVKHFSTGDKAQFMLMRYDKGIEFHTGIGASQAPGTTFPDSVNLRWAIDNDGHFTPGVHSLFDAGASNRRIRSGYFNQELHTGSIHTKVASLSSGRSLNNGETVALCDTSSSGFTVTLPSAASCIDRIYRVKKKSTDLNILTISSGDLIDGDATALIKFPYSSLDFASDGTNWWIL